VQKKAVAVNARPLVSLLAKLLAPLPTRSAKEPKHGLRIQKQGRFMPALFFCYGINTKHKASATTGGKGIKHGT